MKENELYNEYIQHLNQISDVTRNLSDFEMVSESQTEDLYKYIMDRMQNDRTIVQQSGAIYVPERLVKAWENETGNTLGHSESAALYIAGSNTIITEGSYNSWSNRVETGSGVRSSQLVSLSESFTDIRRDIDRSESTLTRISEIAGYYTDGSTARQLDPEMISDINNAPDNNGIYKDGNTVYITKGYIDSWKLENGLSC
jgi:hypothetical protein